MVSVERLAGPEQGEQAPGHPTPAAATLHQAHSGVCSTRYARRLSHGRGPRTARAQLGHRSRRVDRARSDATEAPRGTLVSSPHPRTRSVIVCLLITAAAGLLYLALVEMLQWDSNPEIVWLGLLSIVFVGAVCENAIRFDSLGDARDQARRTDLPGAATGQYPGVTA